MDRNRLKNLEDKAELLKALAHPVRLCIIEGLMQNKCNVTKIQTCLGLPQSTISQHIGVLKAKGILKGERRGLEICYEVVNEEAKKILEILLQK